MPDAADAQKQDLLDRVQSLIAGRARPGDADRLSVIAREFFREVPPADMQNRDPEALYGAIVSLCQFMAKRRPGVAKIRVYNPTIEEHGWRSPHTVVEVVNDDMPFLVDSVNAELQRLEHAVFLVVHPIFRIARTRRHELAYLGSWSTETGEPIAEDGADGAESVMFIEIGRETDAGRIAELETALAQVLEQVRAAVEDWQKMRRKLVSLAGGLKKTNAPVSPQRIEDVREFLSWLAKDHFTFLGFRDYAFSWPKDRGARLSDVKVEVDAGSGLGILRDPEEVVFDELRSLPQLPREVHDFVEGPQLLLVTKASRKSPVHRPVHMDAIALKQYDAEGRVVKLRLFVGLFTADVYTNASSFVPLLRQKMARVLDKSGLRRGSHDAKKLVNILENLPRDELFQTSDDELLRIAMGIMHLQDRKRVALFVRQDEFERFMSCLVYVPRDRFDTALRFELQRILEDSFNGRMIAFNTQVTEAPLARVHFVIKTEAGRLPDYSARDIERRLADAAKAWVDHLYDTLIDAKGEEAGLKLFKSYGAGFPVNYAERFSPFIAVQDIDLIDRVVRTGAMQMSLYRLLESPEAEVHFKIFNANRAVPLSDILPMIENMGFRVIVEEPYQIRPDGDAAVFAGCDPADGHGVACGAVWMHDFGMVPVSGEPVDIGRVRDMFQDAFSRVWAGEMEDDPLNRLVVSAGLSWREITVLRAYAHFLRQARFRFSRAYVMDALTEHSAISAGIVAYFRALFDPAHNGDPAEAERIRGDLSGLLEGVQSADKDLILQAIIESVERTLRTNFFLSDSSGAPLSYLSLKFDSRNLSFLPLPRPWVEVFVYSPRTEGVHLRGGPVARGGIRWSDRPEDYRTEILGLMKAQMVKNAVIVPVGAKGGFVVKRPPADAGRDAQQAEAIACYRILISGLLDITDNLDGDTIAPPAHVIRRDDDDPYLVVAADKGTATFSDIANEVAIDYGYWLGDGFASGGSYGYDHKEMGITARGAWVCVQRHFRELGIDVQSEPVSVIGIGDMSGDVFGNGMLQSEAIRLIAAFNHLHVFIDPDPDPKAAFAERKRLFEMGRSSWSDYDEKAISKGGGVFSRRAKSLSLSPEAQALFGLKSQRIAPNDLITHLLRAEVDLLWFGGIGTYVKASTESDQDAGDRANDAVRVDANALRARVIGEGANLGITQRGRIEYALSGGRLNTDAIDNSAGVDCSDHEVNIKILLNGLVTRGDLTQKQRNRLLQSMTAEVADLVLRDNYLQSQAISYVRSQAMAHVDYQERLMRMLERLDRLNRRLEYLPDEETLAERHAAGEGLTRPEISVLMPYAKLWLFDEILASDLPDEPFMAGELVRYFPSPLGKKYKSAIGRHRLRREIVATSAANSVVNRMGGTFVMSMMERTGLTAADVTRAFIAGVNALSLRALWTEIEALDYRISADSQMSILKDIALMVERSTVWVARRGEKPLRVTDLSESLKPRVEGLRGCLEQVLADDVRPVIEKKCATYADFGVGADLCRALAHLQVLFSAYDIGELAARHERPVPDVARLYFLLGFRFGFSWLRDQAEAQSPANHWQRLALSSLVEELYNGQRDLTDAVIATAPKIEDAEQALDYWTVENARAVERADQLMTELKGATALDPAMLTVANRQYRSMTGA